MAGSSLLLPERSVLLHIGPSKTGTTAIQQALFEARPKMAELGVLHAGLAAQPMNAVLALRGVKPLVGHAPPRFEQWEWLVEQVTTAADRRVIVSSEFFADANIEDARRMVRELGGPRIHVVVTLRPLTKIMPSQWQQYLRNRATFTYDDWLVGMLKTPPYDRPTPTFWERHHHDVLVERWASIVGPANLTVVVPQEGDRSSLLRTFEELVGLPSGLLVVDRSTENRSMTFGEIELVRQLNIEFQRNGWSDELYRQIVRKGFAAQMHTNRTPFDDEPRITTPQWALDRAAEIGAAAAEKLSTLGVRIVGDIASLGARVVTQERAEALPADRFMAIEAAREAVLGTMVASGLGDSATFVENTTARDLIRVLRGRILVRARAEVERAAVALHLATEVPNPAGYGSPARRDGNARD